jgi:hypothetical protein
LLVKSFSLIALLLEKRLRCGILAIYINDELDMHGSFSEITGKLFSSIIVAGFFILEIKWKFRNVQVEEIH